MKKVDLGTCVIGVGMHLGCYGLPVEKVRHHLLLAGIEGTTISTNPQQLGLLCDQGIASGTDRRWRAPLEFSKRGNLPGGTYLSHRLPSIPVLPQHDHVLKQPRRFFPRHVLTIKYSTMFRTSGDGRGSAQGGHDYQTSSIRHPGWLIRGLTLLLDALALDPRLSAERTLGDVSLGAEESLRTQALWCGSDGPDDNPCRGHYLISNQGSPWPCWMPRTGDLNQLLQLSEVTQGR